MYPENMYVVYNDKVNTIESVHPYWELAISKMRKLCEKRAIDPEAQQTYIIGTLAEAIDWVVTAEIKLNDLGNGHIG